MKLYEIIKELEEFQFEIDEETGEILNIQDLDSLNIAKAEKTENIALWIKNLESDSKAIREEEKALAERRRAKEKKAESLTKYLEYVLNGDGFESAKVKISFRKSQSVSVADVDALPEVFTIIKKTADKTATKNALKSGFYIEGCEIVENNNIQIK